MTFEEYLEQDGWTQPGIHPSILTYRHNIPPGHALEDIQQEALMRAFIRFHRYDPERGSFGRWIHVQAHDAYHEMWVKAGAKKRKSLYFQGDEGMVPTAYIDGSATGDTGLEGFVDDGARE